VSTLALCPYLVLSRRKSVLVIVIFKPLANQALLYNYFTNSTKSLTQFYYCGAIRFFCFKFSAGDSRFYFFDDVADRSSSMFLYSRFSRGFRC
jgi:hypothetical protein